MFPKPLEKGDRILIIAPAKYIEKKYIDNAVKVIEERGFKAIVSKYCLGQEHYFSGTEVERIEDLQWAIDHKESKAILCSRGGYGCIQIVDKVNWEYFIKNPKWILGFSDITVFHQKLSKLDIPSIHATMPLNFLDNTKEALQSVFDSLSNTEVQYTWEANTNNQHGNTTGELIGGNLSVLRGLIGTELQPNYENKILFLEEVGEYLYAIDRNLHQFAKAGILNQISGMIIGDFSEIKDTTPSFGKNLFELIKSHVAHRDIPLAFNFPAGHCNDNRALVLGKEVKLTVSSDKIELSDTAQKHRV